MKIKNILSLALFVLIVSFIASCSDNSTSTTTTPAGTILYSQDSIAVWIPASQIAYGQDSLYYSTTNTGGVKVEFTVQSNADSTHSVGNWSIYTNATPAVILNHPILDSIDSQESINFNFSASGSTYFALAVRLGVNNSLIPY